MRNIRNLALGALIASPLLAACMPETPDTQLNWDANTRMTKSQARATAAPAAPRSNGTTPRYVYQDQYAPRPRPEPSYVSRDMPAYSPSGYGQVSSQPLAPLGNAPRFDWPVNGRIIANFGATTNGGKNDGIDIAAGFGTPIKAAAAGTITYAGSELRDYGNLVLVKHAGGYTTAYAHADQLTVHKGDTVSRGQTIGYVGQTGDVTSPQLHFEVRQQAKPVDPRSLLSSAQASAGY